MLENKLQENESPLKKKKNQIQAAEDAKFNYVGQRKSFCL
jgi:hypothetical protein